MRWIAWAFVAALAAGCAGAAEDDEPRTSRAAAANEADVEPAAPPRVDEAFAAPPPRQPAIYELAIEPVDVRRAENGRGERVAAVAPRALIVRADSWPGRALDPVLHIGQLHFHAYDHPSKSELRYVVADVALLPAGAEAALQYGDDTRSRVVLSTALEVPR